MTDQPSRHQVQEIIESYKEWELGGGRFKGPQPVLPLARFSEGSDRLHNLKNLEAVRYLQWESWDGPTINLGYTDNANSDTARNVARWFMARNGGNDGPLTYGETIAIGYGTRPSFYRYKDRPFGVNLANVESPAFEWKLLGGVAGEPVKTGEHLAIYNEVDSNVLIRFNQTFGVSLGWPDSKTFMGRVGGKVREWTKEAVEKAVKEFVKNYLATA